MTQSLSLVEVVLSLTAQGLRRVLERVSQAEDLLLELRPDFIRFYVTVAQFLLKDSLLFLDVGDLLDQSLFSLLEGASLLLILALQLLLLALEPLLLLLYLSCVLLFLLGEPLLVLRDLFPPHLVHLLDLLLLELDLLLVQSELAPTLQPLLNVLIGQLLCLSAEGIYFIKEFLPVLRELTADILYLLSALVKVFSEGVKLVFSDSELSVLGSKA